MQSITGIFTNHEMAERAATELRAPGIAGDRISVLRPGTSPSAIATEVPTNEGEQPGVGPTLGGVVGAAAGAAGGMQIAAAAAFTLLPFGAPVIVTGLLAGGLVGTGAGIAIGKALEDHLPEGLPRDELILYEEALRQGKSVVIALVESDEQASAGRAVLAAAGAEDLDAARRSPRIGLEPPETRRDAA
jgi:hypothetical protein